MIPGCSPVITRPFFFIVVFVFCLIFRALVVVGFSMTAPTCAQRVPSPGAADGMAEAAEDTATRVSPLRHHHHHVHQHHHHHHHHPRLPELRPESSDDDCPADRTRTRFRPTSSPVSWPLLLALLVLATLQLPQVRATSFSFWFVFRLCFDSVCGQALSRCLPRHSFVGRLYDVN